MGRWAQRQRRGGGAGTRPPPTITMVSVVIESNPAGMVFVTFSAPIDVGELSPGDFFNPDIGFPADTITQEDPNTFFVSAVLWIGVLNAGQIVIYSGSAPDVVTPQSVPIT